MWRGLSYINVSHKRSKAQHYHPQGERGHYWQTML